MAFPSSVFYFLVKLLGSPAAMAADVAVSPQPAKADKAPVNEDSGEEKKAAQESLPTVEKKKKVIVNKSTLVIEIKPNTIDTDLEAVEMEVRKIKIPGVDWSAACKKVPIAFGLNKLQMGCVIIDDLVATDDIILKIESIGMTPEQSAEFEKKRDTGDDNEEVDDNDDEENTPGWVQSAEIVSFQKL